MAIVHHEDTKELNELTTNKSAAGDGSDLGYP